MPALPPRFKATKTSTHALCMSIVEACSRWPGLVPLAFVSANFKGSIVCWSPLASLHVLIQYSAHILIKSFPI